MNTSSSILDSEWTNFLHTIKENNDFSLKTVSSTLSKPAAAATATAATVDGTETQTSICADAAPASVHPTPPPPLRPPLQKNLFISTKTKVLFLNSPIKIHDIFWNIPILDYWLREEGVLKKTIKFVSHTPEQRDEIRAKLGGFYKEEIIKQIDAPPKFKDERKVSVGISKKDIMACRAKKKNVFYNCFSLVLRIFYNNEFKEIHVKIFNTGKMEIPGVLNDTILEISKNMTLDILRAATNSSALDYIVMEDENKHNVLINSNFSCGYFVNRDKLHQILNKKYNMDTSYDPCTYPGVKCKFYYNNEAAAQAAVEGAPPAAAQNGRIEECDYNLSKKSIELNKKYTEVSIMIFRTGSGLIVGNCSEKILNVVYDFIANMLHEEYYTLYVSNSAPVVKVKNTKVRRKIIIYDNIDNYRAEKRRFDEWAQSER
jgi:hypothetical protein